MYYPYDGTPNEWMNEYIENVKSEVGEAIVTHARTHTQCRTSV